MASSFQSAPAGTIDYSNMTFANMDWRSLYTRFDGRIGQRQFWIGFAGLMAANIALMIVIGILASISPVLNNLAYLVSLAMLYPSLALNAKRWHDRGKSGWWSLVLLIPILGPLYALYELGFQPAAD